MTPDRLKKLSLWLERVAEKEDGTAAVLAKLKDGDPELCRTRAKVFREVALYLKKMSRDGKKT